MGKEIKNPLKSEMCMAVLNRVLVMEEPYPSAIADSLDQQYGNIQSYIDTMVKKGWLSKKRSGRKKILKLNTWEIWKENDGPQRLQLYSEGEVAEKPTDAVNNRANNFPNKSIDEDLKKFLILTLEYKIRNSMAFESSLVQEVI